jgi:hypothetical protein
MKSILFSLNLLIALMCLNNSALKAETEIDEINQYEIRSYDPQKSGLADLVFEARIDKLTDILNKTQNFGKLFDVHYKIYWILPNQYKIEVMGLPKGFQEVKDDLITLIKGKLEFVIPEKLSEKFRGYKLKIEPITDGKLIKAIDDTFTMIIPEIDLVFDNGGRLKYLENKLPTTGSMKSEFFQTPKSWSNNKLVMDKIILTTKQAGVTATVINLIEYSTTAGIGFPSKVTVKNIIESITPATKKEKEKKNKVENTSSIKFSAFEVNTGKATRFINEGLRR